MDRSKFQEYLNHITANDGAINVLTNIRPEDTEKLYLCDSFATINADILTAFYSPIGMTIEIIFTQNVVDLQPTNECSRFIQRIDANERTMPICGPILLSASCFTCIYVKSDPESLRTLKCYGLSLSDNDALRILKRYMISSISLSVHPFVILEYENGFVKAREKRDDETMNGRFLIMSNPYYDSWN